MKFNMYNQKTKEIKMMEFESVADMWEWHDIPVNQIWKAYDKMGEVVYRVAIFQ